MSETSVEAQQLEIQGDHIEEDTLRAGIGKYVETYGPYLTDLWFRLYKTTILFCFVFARGFFVADPVLKLFLRMFSIPGVPIVATTPFQFIVVFRL